MGITQVEPRDAERFEEGNDSDFQDAEEIATRETDTGDRIEPEARGPGEIHGGFGSATSQACANCMQSTTQTFRGSDCKEQIWGEIFKHNGATTSPSCAACWVRTNMTAT